jgi:hypothetical protein
MCIYTIRSNIASAETKRRFAVHGKLIPYGPLFSDCKPKVPNQYYKEYNPRTN